MIKSRYVGKPIIRAISKGPAVFVVLLAFACRASAAQAPPPAPQYPDDETGDVLPAPASQIEGEAATPAGAAQNDDETIDELTPGAEMTLEQQQAVLLLQLHIKQVRLGRAPSAVIEALARRAAAAQAADGTADAPATARDDQGDAENEAEMRRVFTRMQKFQAQVVTGDWQGVQDYLAQLPGGIRSKVYAHLLNLLAADPRAVVLPNEMAPLADASPTGLTAGQLAALGRLLRCSVDTLGRPEALLARVRAGTRRLGGDDRAGRLAAARMFLEAGMLDEAGEYLPPLDESLNEGDPATWNFLAQYQQARGLAKSDPAAMLASWQFTRLALERPSLKPRERAAAVRNMLGIWSQLPGDLAAPWLRDLFVHRPELGLFVLAEAGRQVETAAAAPDQPARRKALATLRSIVTELLAAVGEEPGRWSTPLEMLTASWLLEAERTNRPAHGNQPNYRRPQQRIAGTTRTNSSRRRVPAHYPGSSAYRGTPSYNNNAYSDGQADSNDVPPLPPEALLSLAPDDAWCRAIDPDLGHRVRYLIGVFAARTADRDALVEALARLDQSSDGAQGGKLVEQYVQAWTQRVRNGQADQPRGIEAGAIPLTRARQVRDLARYGELIEWLHGLSVPLPAADVMVDAFDACHSPAEVYREDDLRRAFGDPNALEPKLATSLASKLQENLAGAWRQPDVQERQGTRRSDQEHLAEVTRGYQLAERVLAAAVERAPDAIGPRLLLATLEFDQAEFLYGQKVELARYTALRDRAFDLFRQSAEVYAQRLRQDPSAITPSIEVYRQWFQAALGASDLAYLTRQDEPDHDQIDRLSASLRALGDEASRQHLALFGESLAESPDELPPQLKPRYLREALRVLGEHPSGEPARALLRYYDELLSEVQLHLAIDGSDRVGHGRRFGVRFSLRNRRELGRESGGFGHLLVNQAVYTGDGEVNYREQLERDLREKLAKVCEIESITFHDPSIEPRGFGREGWEEWPLAYLVLRANDPAVDRLPVVQVDLPFSDGRGMVLLPIPSQVVLLDAREPRPPLRPMRELKLKQVLDDRQGDVLRLELLATAKGLLPELESLVDLGAGQMPGYRLRQIHDQGLDVATLDVRGEAVEPVCERSWVVELERLGDEPSAEFAFPRALDTAAELSYARYDDADIVEAAATVPLRRGLLAGRTWRWLALPSAAIAGVGLLLFTVRTLVRRRRKAAPQARYQRPARLTPFNLVVLLKRIHRDDVLRLSPGEQASLSETIESLERDYFGVPAESAAAHDLEPLLNRWLARAGNGLLPNGAAR